MAVSMYLQGRADLGTWAALKMIPLALGILALAAGAVQRKLHLRPWFGRGVVVGGVLALMMSRWILARPRPSPLDPMLRQYQQHVAATAAMDANRAAQQTHAKSRALEPSEQARKELSQRTTRFS